jgi:hypothetical protein
MKLDVRVKETEVASVIVQRLGGTIPRPIRILVRTESKARPPTTPGPWETRFLGLSAVRISQYVTLSGSWLPPNMAERFPTPRNEKQPMCDRTLEQNDFDRSRNQDHDNTNL